MILLGSELLCCREQHVLNDSGPLIWLFVAFILFISLLLFRFYHRDCLHVKVREYVIKQSCLACTSDNSVQLWGLFCTHFLVQSPLSVDNFILLSTRARHWHVKNREYCSTRFKSESSLEWIYTRPGKGCFGNWKRQMGPQSGFLSLIPGVLRRIR